MDLKSLSTKAKELIDKRGGTDSLKEDAEDLKSIATGEGSLSDKAKAAVEAIKDPGATPEAAAELDEPEQPAAQPDAAAQAPESPPADDPAGDRERRGRAGQGRGGGGGRGGGRGRRKRA